MKYRDRLLQKILFQIIPSGPYGDLKRGALYKKYLKNCGKNFKVAEQAFIFSPELLDSGDDVYIGFGSYLGNGSIILGNQVLIGNHVSITPSNHLRKDKSFRFGGSKNDGVVINEGAWIAAHSCILAGVTIGKGALVAAGSIVTSNIPDFVLVAGAPAKIIKELDENG